MGIGSPVAAELRQRYNNYIKASWKFQNFRATEGYVACLLMESGPAPYSQRFVPSLHDLLQIVGNRPTAILERK